jgi:hypothetical protein
MVHAGERNGLLFWSSLLLFEYNRSTYNSILTGLKIRVSTSCADLS